MDFYQTQDTVQTTDRGTCSDDEGDEADIVIQEELSDVEADLCGRCHQVVEETNNAIGCEGTCKQWFHQACIHLSDVDFQQYLDVPTTKWSCTDCTSPPLASPAMLPPPVDTPSSIDHTELGTEITKGTGITKAVDLPRAEQPNIPPVGTSSGDIAKAKWGKLRGLDILSNVNAAYTRVVKWQRNIFQVPSGKAGKAFIEELTKAVSYFTASSNLEAVAITMIMILPPLLLQKPSKNSKSKDHVSYLIKRLEWWRNGDLDLLIKEGDAIQKRLVFFVYCLHRCDAEHHSSGAARRPIFARYFRTLSGSVFRSPTMLLE